MAVETPTAPPAIAVQCSECNTQITDGMERQNSGDQTFCQPCFNNLHARMEQAITAQGTDINYSFGFAGAALGGALGAMAWWGFTVLTEIQFGLVAVIIGIAVGKGAVMFTGNKRSVGLQIMSVGVAAISFAYGSYLVNRTFLMQALSADGENVVLPLFPNPEIFMNVVGLSFGMFEVLFLGFALWEAWKIPAPVKMV
jgi:hypothetical protein